MKLLRVEINRAREMERVHQETTNEMTLLEEKCFKIQQEAWNLRDLLAEKGIKVPNDVLMMSLK